MKKIFYYFALLGLISCKKIIIENITVPTALVIEISHDTLLLNNTVWDGGGKILRIKNSKIYGVGILKNWIIDAPSQIIFDTTIKLQNCKTYLGYFNTYWYGTSPTNTDNTPYFQLSFNTAIQNTMLNVYIPTGRYTCKSGLNVATFNNGILAQTTLHIFGDTKYATDGTVLYFTQKTGNALNFQLSKGGEINNIALLGTWKSPTYKDSNYYSISFDNYKDISGNNNEATGFSIDGYYYNTLSGSTGVKVHDCYIGGFATLIGISQNAQTANADNLIFENINCGDGRVIYKNGQAQEKNNVLKHFQCWANNHTGFLNGKSAKWQAGDYTLNNWNFAGRIILLFDINASGWYSTKVNDCYAESFGRIAVVNTQVPITFNTCTFQPAFKEYAGRQILISSNSALTSFNNCLIRYYNGVANELWIHGNITFNNCGFYKDKLVWK